MGTATIFAPKPAASTNGRTLGARIKSALRIWVARMQQRQQLAAMNTYELRDIGLTRSDVVREVQKAPWQG
jgi:uncharacterized protein YjiS (DUF1127 family)